MSYTYDLGGNRTCKVDLVNATCTMYHYDLEDPALYGHKANRLMWYETRALQGGETGCACTGTRLETVAYEYALDGPAAGNVIQVARKVPFDPSGYLEVRGSGLLIDGSDEKGVRLTYERQRRTLVGLPSWLGSV